MFSENSWIQQNKLVTRERCDELPDPLDQRINGFAKAGGHSFPDVPNHRVPIALLPTIAPECIEPHADVRLRHHRNEPFDDPSVPKLRDKQHHAVTFSGFPFEISLGLQFEKVGVSA